MRSPLEVCAPWKKGGALVLVGTVAVTLAVQNQEPTLNHIKIADYTEKQPELLLHKVVAKAGVIATAKADICITAQFALEAAACSQANGTVAHSVVPLPELAPIPTQPALAPAVVAPEAPITTTTEAPTTTTTTVPVMAPNAANTTGVTPAQYNAWLKVNICEEGGKWNVNGPNFSGGLGFTHANWDRFNTFGFPADAADATPAEQIQVAVAFATTYLGGPNAAPDQNGCSGGY
jgi:hypothetical protein